MKNFILTRRTCYCFSSTYCPLHLPECGKMLRKIRIEKEEIESIIIKYLNRLSDYLFVLARYIAHQLKAEEIPWKPRV